MSHARPNPVRAPVRRVPLRERPRPIQVKPEIHVLGCDCPACEPYRPSVPARLTIADMTRLGAGGLLFGNAIAFAHDAPAAWAALKAAVGL